MPTLLRPRGFTLLGVAIAVAILGSIAVALPYFYASNQQMRTNQLQSEQSYFSNRAAIEFANRQILVDGNPPTIPIRYFMGTAFNISRAGGKVSIITTNGSANSSYSFNDTATGFNLASPVTYSTANTPIDVQAGDFNGDGYQDIATANYTSNNVSILLNNAKGTFANTVNYAAGRKVTSLALGDMNGDSRPDIVVVNQTDSKFDVFKGAANGTFAKFAGSPFTGGTDNVVVTVGDIDNDKDIDVMTGNYTAGRASVFRNNALSTAFTLAASAFSVSTKPASIINLDLNNDKRLDLITISETTSRISRMLSTSPFTGSTFSKTDINLSCSKPDDIVGGYFNADAFIDVALTCNSGSQMAVLLNTGSGGNFGTATYYTTLAGPAGIDQGDLNADGKTDLVVSDYTPGKISVFLGNGDGTFQAKKDFDVLTSNSVNALPAAVWLADVNADSKKDIITANYGTNNVSVLLNTTN